jgi:acyl-CoA hydrolase
VGTERLYRFVDQNPEVEFHPVSTTHDARVLAGLARLVAVNSALEVDLTGQVNAEWVAGSPLGATGGQVDFLRGAAASPDGLAVIALPSTTGDRTRSRIVDRLSGPVTSLRTDLDVVVTEHGVADLRGPTDRERVSAMLAIADPAFRPELER